MVKTTPFQKALKGSYKTALLKVEKPEKATNRYGTQKSYKTMGLINIHITTA